MGQVNEHGDNDVGDAARRWAQAMYFTATLNREGRIDLHSNVLQTGQESGSVSHEFHRDRYPVHRVKGGRPERVGVG